ncbi:MAG: hypothetical protein QOI31_2169 [Solirubrobacterales bacterium]|nr:hypothetical protein [Solirubrobacterales bacterium]
MRRLLGIGICALVVLGTVLGPATASAAKAEAKVVIDQYTPPPLLGSWDGHVKSERKACEKERQVIVYRREGKENVEIGSENTYRNGNKWLWTVVTGDETEGKYFAIAPPTPKCKYSESKLFDLPDDNPPPRPF